MENIFAKSNRRIVNTMQHELFQSLTNKMSLRKFKISCKVILKWEEYNCPKEVITGNKIVQVI